MKRLVDDVIAKSYDAVRKSHDDRYADEFRSRARELPTLLRTSGLVATLAYLSAKANEKNDVGKSYQLAYNAIIKQIYGSLGVCNSDDVFQHILKDSGKITTEQYMKATEEASIFAGWLSKAADALRSDNKGRTSEERESSETRDDGNEPTS